MRCCSSFQSQGLHRHWWIPDTLWLCPHVCFCNSLRTKCSACAGAVPVPALRLERRPAPDIGWGHPRAKAHVSPTATVTTNLGPDPSPAPCSGFRHYASTRGQAHFLVCTLVMRVLHRLSDFTFKTEVPKQNYFQDRDSRWLQGNAPTQAILAIS